MSSPSDLIGSWNYKETPLKTNPVLKPPEGSIVIKAGANCPQSFDVKVPVNPESFGVAEIDLNCIPVILDTAGHYTLSGSASVALGAFGMRLVFDLSVNPPQFFYGPLGSTVERWGGPAQPNDMGTITGTKG